MRLMRSEEARLGATSTNSRTETLKIKRNSNSLPFHVASSHLDVSRFRPDRPPPSSPSEPSDRLSRPCSCTTMSNNPFLEAQQVPAYARYPDISSPSLAQPSWQQQPAGTPGFPQQSSFPHPHPSSGQQSSSLQPNGGDAYGYSVPGGTQSQYQNPMTTGAQGGFRPTSSFGQQMAAQLNTGYGAPQAGQYGGGISGGGGGYQPTGAGWNPPGYQQQVLSQFDPYSQLGQFDAPQGSGVGLFGGSGGPGPSPTSPMPTPSPAPPSVMSSAPPPGQQHPRELVRAHKGELELWDAYAWKQLMNSFETLRGAWEVRKREAEERMRSIGAAVNWDYGAAQEAHRLQAVCPLCPIDL